VALLGVLHTSYGATIFFLILAAFCLEVNSPVPLTWLDGKICLLLRACKPPRRLVLTGYC
jgi:hypothetical protein